MLPRAAPASARRPALVVTETSETRRNLGNSAEPRKFGRTSETRRNFANAALSQKRGGTSETRRNLGSAAEPRGACLHESRFVVASFFCLLALRSSSLAFAGPTAIVPVPSIVRSLSVARCFWCWFWAVVRSVAPTHGRSCRPTRAASEAPSSFRGALHLTHEDEMDYPAVCSRYRTR